jgi:hypothetical protein
VAVAGGEVGLGVIGVAVGVADERSRKGSASSVGVVLTANVGVGVMNTI